LGTALAVWGLGLLGAGSASAEKSLLGITVGRSYRTVLAKYGTPDRIDAVVIPTGTAPALGGQYGGVGGFGQPGAGQPGFGGPGAPGDPSGGGFPGAPGASPFGGGGPGGFPGAPGASPFGGASAGAFPGGPGGPSAGGFPGSGGPPVLPGSGGFPGASGDSGGGFPGGPGGFPGGPGAPGDPGGFGGFGGGQAGGVTVGNAALYTYRKQGGVTYEFLINEDGLVAQISVSGKKADARMGQGIKLGSSYADVLRTYGYPQTHLMTSLAATGMQQASMSYSAMVRSGGQVTQITYPKVHHIAFAMLNQRVVRMTVALAE
jgi:hypothetical protein